MRSLSSILLPRLKEGDASRDLASGIAAQVTFEAFLMSSLLLAVTNKPQDDWQCSVQAACGSVGTWWMSCPALHHRLQQAGTDCLSIIVPA